MMTNRTHPCSVSLVSLSRGTVALLSIDGLTVQVVDGPTSNPLTEIWARRRPAGHGHATCANPAIIRLHFSSHLAGGILEADKAACGWASCGRLCDSSRREIPTRDGTSDTWESRSRCRFVGDSMEQPPSDRVAGDDVAWARPKSVRRRRSSRLLVFRIWMTYNRQFSRHAPGAWRKCGCARRVLQAVVGLGGSCRPKIHASLPH